MGIGTGFPHLWLIASVGSYKIELINEDPALDKWCRLRTT